MTANGPDLSPDDLAREAAWWRSEHDRLGRELARMTPAHADAIGPVAVRRMQVDHETALQLARECEIRLDTRPGAGAQSEEDVPLF